MVALIGLNFRYILLALFICVGLLIVTLDGNHESRKQAWVKSLKNVLPSSNAPLNARERLERSEAIYQEFVRRRDTALDSKGFNKKQNFNPDNQFDQWWWYFQPAFQCPHDLQRVGIIGDGGKWVCGMQQLEQQPRPKCVVYSLGVSNDSSYEQELLERTDCEVFGFDASVQRLANGLDRNPRAHFMPVFVGTKDEYDSMKNKQWRSLGSLMKELGHEWIDLLKIDIEGNEYEVLDALMDEFEGQPLPFSQLQLEIHLRLPNRRKISFERFITWWRRLEEHGLRPFWTELNILPTLLLKQPLWYSEYSFINIAGQHRLLED